MSLRLLLLVLTTSQQGGALHEEPDLGLRGDGCHVELLAGDGGVICKAVATPVARCAPLTAFVSEDDGGLGVRRFQLGSSCPAPHLASVVLGNGAFFVEKNAVVFAVICDDAPACHRAGQRKRILACCAREPSIRDSAVCRVSPYAGVCVEGQ